MFFCSPDEALYVIIWHWRYTDFIFFTQPNATVSQRSLWNWESGLLPQYKCKWNHQTQPNTTHTPLKANLIHKFHYFHMSERTYIPRRPNIKLLQIPSQVLHGKSCILILRSRVQSPPAWPTHQSVLTSPLCLACWSSQVSPRVIWSLVGTISDLVLKNSIISKAGCLIHSSNKKELWHAGNSIRGDW